MMSLVKITVENLMMMDFFKRVLLKMEASGVLCIQLACSRGSQLVHTYVFFS